MYWFLFINLDALAANNVFSYAILTRSFTSSPMTYFIGDTWFEASEAHFFYGFG